MIQGKIENGKSTKQEWDGVVYSADKKTLYVLEAKHKLSVNEVEDVARRLPILEQLVSNPDTNAFKGLVVSAIQVVVSGLLFSKEAMEVAGTNKFFVAFPSGYRYTTSDREVERCSSSS